MRSTLLSFALVTWSLTAVACGGTSDNSSADGGPARPQLTGTWFWRAPNNFETTYAFRDDGTLSVDKNNQPIGRALVEGTWSLQDNGLHYEGAVTSDDYEWQYYAADHEIALGDDYFLTDAMRPIGTPDGLVGTWRNTQSVTITWQGDDQPSSPQTTTYELTVAASGSASYVKRIGDSAANHQGTWLETASGLDFSYDDIYGQQRTLSFVLVDGALGLEAFQRQ